MKPAALFVRTLQLVCLLGTAPAGSEVAYTIEKGDGYILAVPPGTTHQKRSPLLVSLHGTDQSPSDAFGPWLAACKSRNAFILCPAAMDGAWDADRDVTRITGMVREVTGKHPVAPERVYLAGFSSGATMAYILACRRAGLFNGLVLASGHFDGLIKALGRVPPRIPVFIVHGKKDAVFSYKEARMLAKALRRNGNRTRYRWLRNHGHQYPPAEVLSAAFQWLVPREQK